MIKKARKDFMNETMRKALENTPRTHQNCIAKTGVARPGKTAHDRWKQANRE